MKVEEDNADNGEKDNRLHQGVAGDEEQNSAADKYGRNENQLLDKRRLSYYAARILKRADSLQYFLQRTHCAAFTKQGQAL
jgi:hypothetical protein